MAARQVVTVIALAVVALACRTTPTGTRDDPVIELKLGITRVFLLKAQDGYLQIDTGRPDEYDDYREMLRDLDIAVEKIDYLLLTHHHGDHAGFAARLISDSGARLVVASSARAPLAAGKTEDTMSSANWCAGALSSIGTLFEGEFDYPPVKVSSGDLLLARDDDQWLPLIGVSGRVLITPGHTHDSISVVLDGGDAFVGDLAMNVLNVCRLRRRPILAEDMEEVRRSWAKLQAAGAVTIHTAHGKAFPASDLSPSH